MSLHARLFELLSTPAARAASDDDTRRAVARLIGCEPPIAQGFSPGELTRRRARLARRLAHLQRRIVDVPSHSMSYDVAEVSALQTALVLFDAAIAAGGPPTAGAPVLCPECKDLEGRAWRRHAEIELGDDEAVRTAPAEQLRRSLTQLIEDQAHTIDVMAECNAAGNPDGVRMHYEHARGPQPDLSTEAPDCPKCGSPIVGKAFQRDGRFYHLTCSGVEVSRG